MKRIPHVDDAKQTLEGMKQALIDWTPPPEWRRVRFVDAHAAGEPLRVVIDGFEDLDGDSVLEMRRDARERFDWLRRALMWEPRGHADMYGCILLPPVSDQADLAVLFTHNEGFSTMCGHGIIAVATVLAETGAVGVKDGRAVLGIDTPAGFVEARVRPGTGEQFTGEQFEDLAEAGRSSEGRSSARGTPVAPDDDPENRTGHRVLASEDRLHPAAREHTARERIKEVSFTNVPSFALSLDNEVRLPKYGRVRFDLAFGGAFYAYVDADRLGLALEPGNIDEIVRAGRAIKSAVAECEIRHPVEPELSFLYGTVFIDRAMGRGSGGPSSAVGSARLADSTSSVVSTHRESRPGTTHGRHVCVFADGEVDRSPTGTGVAGRLALLFARGEIDAGREVTIDGIAGEAFRGSVLRTTKVGSLDAVVPEISGRAHITGRGEFLIDLSDPLATGFFLR